MVASTSSGQIAVTIAFSRSNTHSVVSDLALPRERPDDSESADAPPAPSPVALATARAQPSGRPSRRTLRAMLRLCYRVLRPLLRPLAHRTRSFLLHETTMRLADLQRGQALMVRDLSEQTPPRQVAAPTTWMPPRRKVHQFHAGSATSDAITNAMLLLQGRLRDLGYDSEIYVEHIGDGLADRLQPLAALPKGDDFVLLVHHSMGHGSLDRLMASPCRKILIYHNITPPELLSHNRHMQEAAILGRRQLALWRDHVVTAIADSVFNGVELRQLGFASVQEAALLFDVAMMGGAPAREAAAPYTVLFVARLAPSKGHAALIEAFSLFARRFAMATSRGARLVLVGGAQADAPAYRARLERLVAAQCRHCEVLITGKLADADLRAWYRRADVYVSLSGHEGFGVPLVEAMAYGLPVIARRAGAVAETMGPNGLLLDDDAPEPACEAMLNLALDPAMAALVVRRQTTSLARWAWPAHFAVLQRALLQAGMAPPVSGETRTSLCRTLRIEAVGRGGWTKRLARALGGAGHGGNAALVVDVADQPGDPMRSGRVMVLQSCNATRIGIDRVRALNAGADCVLVPSDFVARALLGSGVQVPIRVVGHGHDLTPLRAAPAGRCADARGPRRFLHLAGDAAQAGTDVLLAAWARAFGADDAVRLVLLVAPRAATQTQAWLAGARLAHGDLAPVILEIAELGEPALIAACAAADVMVLPSRADGQAHLVAAIAMASGCALIATSVSWGGVARANVFSVGDGAWALRHGWCPAPTGEPAHALWAEPDEADLVTALRTMRRPTPPRAVEVHDDWADRILSAATEVVLAPPSAWPRVGVVSAWNADGAAASQARHLLAGFRRPPVLFSDTPTADEIGAQDPDVLLIQHDPALLPWEAFAALLRAPALRRRCVVVMLPSALELPLLPPMLRRQVCDALAQVARVLVASTAALAALDRLGLTNGEWLPLGVVAGPKLGMPTMPYASDAPLIGSTGQMPAEPGVQRLLHAAALLRASWPHLRLRLVLAPPPVAAGAREHDACLALAERLGLAGQVEWHIATMPSERARALLGECDLVVLPQEPSAPDAAPDAAPGAALGAVEAAWLAIGSRAPVLVSDLALFEECADAVDRISSTSPPDLAERMAILLRHPERRAALQQRADAWLRAHDWRLLAERLEGMLTGLWRQRLDAATAIAEIAVGGSEGIGNEHHRAGAGPVGAGLECCDR